jgi:hypothetical protein
LAQLLQRQDAVQLLQLSRAVIAIAGFRIDALRPHQADAVVIAQQAAGDARDLGEFSDPEQGSAFPLPALRSVKVKRFVRPALQSARHCSRRGIVIGAAEA